MLVAETAEDTTFSPGAHSSCTRRFTSPAWAQSQWHQGWGAARSPSTQLGLWETVTAPKRVENSASTPWQPAKHRIFLRFINYNKGPGNLQHLETGIVRRKPVKHNDKVSRKGDLLGQSFKPFS